MSSSHDMSHKVHWSGDAGSGLPCRTRYFGGGRWIRIAIWRVDRRIRLTRLPFGGGAAARRIKFGCFSIRNHIRNAPFWRGPPDPELEQGRRHDFSRFSRFSRFSSWIFKIFKIFKLDFQNFQKFSSLARISKFSAKHFQV